MSTLLIKVMAFIKNLVIWQLVYLVELWVVFLRVSLVVWFMMTSSMCFSLSFDVLLVEIVIRRVSPPLGRRLSPSPTFDVVDWRFFAAYASIMLLGVVIILSPTVNSHMVALPSKVL